MAKVHYGSVGLWCYVEDVTSDFSCLVIFVAQLHVKDAHAYLCLSIGVNGNGVVLNLHTQFVHYIDGLRTIVLEGVALNNTAHFLRQRNVRSSTHRDTHLTAFEQTVLHGEVVVVLVLLVDDGVSYEHNIFTGAGCADRSMQVAVVYGSMTTLVLHHHHCLICLVGSVDFEVLQRDIVGLVERHNTVVLLMLVVAVTACGVVVMIYLNVTLTALALKSESVHATHSLDVRNAHLLVIVACLDLQSHRTVHTKYTDIVNGTLNGSIVTTLSYGISTALSACNSECGSNGLFHWDCCAVNGDAVQRCRNFCSN